MRHLLQQSSEHIAAAMPPPASSSGGGVHTDTFLILAAVLCFLLCVVGLALVARCSRLCNPSAFAVEPEEAGTAMASSNKGIKRKALQSIPTVAFEEETEEERPECAICLAEFARGDEVRVLPPCGHGFHAACVDAWLVSSSTCPSCRRALVVVVATPSPATSSARQPELGGGGGGGGCRTSEP
uniref:RING-type domain-containing protein n=1 Tax=Leersia perrieri TaxID=77586 RepID=A0A0D9XGJ0_9ORYZ